MKRLLAGVGTALLVTIGAGVASATTPPDTTPPSAEAPATAHPIVGTWLFTFVGEDEVPFTGAFLSDGVFIEYSDGSTSIGVWEATGPDTAAMTYHAADEEDEGTVTVRASFTVDGDNLSADYTIQFAGEGAPEGEFGPGQVEATRVAVEPMGEPVGSLDELFSSFEEEGTEGTEVATDVTEVATEGTEAAAPPATEATAPPATEMAPPTTS